LGLWLAARLGAAAGRLDGVLAKQLIDPMELEPYCTKPFGVGGECTAVIGG